MEPVGTGTRWAEPISLPFSSGMTRPMALAAPVLLGTMFCGAGTGTTQVALALRAVQDHLVAGVGVHGGHDAGLRWDTASFRAFAMGARQLVVQEAAEMI